MLSLREKVYVNFLAIAQVVVVACIVRYSLFGAVMGYYTPAAKIATIFVEVLSVCICLCILALDLCWIIRFALGDRG